MHCLCAVQVISDRATMITRQLTQVLDGSVRLLLRTEAGLSAGPGQQGEDPRPVRWHVRARASSLCSMLFSKLLELMPCNFALYLG